MIYTRRNEVNSPFASCTINDMYACKEAIARDIESINFTILKSVFESISSLIFSNVISSIDLPYLLFNNSPESFSKISTLSGIY